MALVVMSVEDVLTDGVFDRLANAESSAEGRSLYSALRDTTNILLLSEEPNKGIVRAWLARERFTRYADVHCRPADSPLGTTPWKVQHVSDLISVGHHVAFYLDSDPGAVMGIMDLGVTGMLMAKSAALPGKPEKDQPYHPWYDLVGRMEYHENVRASRTLLEEESHG